MEIMHYRSRIGLLFMDEIETRPANFLKDRINIQLLTHLFWFPVDTLSFSEGNTRVV